MNVGGIKNRATAVIILIDSEFWAAFSWIPRIIRLSREASTLVTYLA